jgi:hypothetical protein
MRLRIKPLAAIGPAIALVINVVLLTAIARSLTVADATILDKAEWNSGLSDSFGHVFSRKPIDSYRQILAKPIFFKSREPFVPPPPSPTPVSKVLSPPSFVDPNLVLGGVMIRKDARKAYLFSRVNTGGAWIGQGEEFMGWQIKSIDEKSATLEQKGQSMNLQLYPKD